MEVEETTPVTPEMQSWLDSLPEYRQKLTSLIHTPLPTYPNPRLASLAESLASDPPSPPLSRQQIKDLVSPLIDSSPSSLSALCRLLTSTYPDLQISTEDLKELIHEIASRTAYGVRDRKKDVYEDEDRAGFWAWQVDAYPQPTDILKERKLLGKSIQSLTGLISSIEKKVSNMQKPNIVKITNQYDAYNKALKKLDTFRTEKSEKKRKRESTELEKSTKKMKIEQEREERKAKLMEERLKAEAEKKAKAEAEKRAKLELSAAKKTPVKENSQQACAAQRTLTGYVSMERKAAGPRTNYRWIFGPELHLKRPKPFEYPSEAIIPNSTEGLPGWKHYLSQEIKRCPVRQGKFIYHAESALKPYFVGVKMETFRLRRNPFLHYIDIDYDKDSDEEFEELVPSIQNAEDIATSHESSSEESDDPGSEEEEEKWIVPDGYLSQDERTDEGESAPVVREEYVGKPSVILGGEDTLMIPLRGFSISNSLFPLSCEIPDAPAKDQSTLNLEDLRRTVLENPYKKDEIIIAYKKLHPDTPKSQIRKAIEAYFLKEVKKGGKKRYVYKDDIPAKPPVFIIIKT